MVVMNKIKEGANCEAGYKKMWENSPGSSGELWPLLFVEQYVTYYNNSFHFPAEQGFFMEYWTNLRVLLQSPPTPESPDLLLWICAAPASKAGLFTSWGLLGTSVTRNIRERKKKNSEKWVTWRKFWYFGVCSDHLAFERQESLWNHTQIGLSLLMENIWF